MAPTTEVHRQPHPRPSVPASQPEVFSNVLNEVRNVLVGASLLLSGLLTAAFAPRFPELTNTELVFYGISLLFVLVADVLLIAPALHQQLFRSERVVEALVPYLVIGAFICLHLGIVSAVGMVTMFVYNNDGLAIGISAGLLVFIWLVWVIIPLLAAPRIKSSS